MFKIFKWFLIISSVVFLTACGGGGGTPPPIDIVKPVIHLNGNAKIECEAGIACSDPKAIVTDNYDANKSISSYDFSKVDKSKVGTYTVNYKAEDSSGNKADEVARTIEVEDTIAPTIVLTASSSGSVDYSMNLGATYIEYGATVTDSFEGDISSRLIVDKSMLDVNKIGTYEIKYKAQDSQGNSAVVMIRKVTVIDLEKPTITINGTAYLYLEAGNTFVDPKAIVTDNYDSDKLISAYNLYELDIKKIGTYRIKYKATDSSGNKADEATRTVEVEDTIAPTIALTASSSGSVDYSMNIGATYIEYGATVTDSFEGDISSKLIVDKSMLDVNKIGTYEIKYKAQDSQSNSAVVMTRKVTVVDTVKPVIHLNGNAKIECEAGIACSDPKAIVTDNYDADKSISSYDFSEVNISKVGTYTVNYKAEDSSGNKADEVARTIEVNDTIAPTIELNPGRNGDINYTMHLNTDYKEYGVTVMDSFEGDISNKFTVDISKLDVNKTNTYEIVYSAKDSQGNKAKDIVRTVRVVDDVEAPVLTLNKGKNKEINYTMEINDPYYEYGAEADDKIDGNLTNDIDINTSSVDTSAIGDYNITYRVFDDARNLAESIRIIHIRDTQPPSIVLNGNNPYLVEVYNKYIDANATVVDNNDPNRTIEGDSSDVNTSLLGDYNVTYNASDKSGNLAPMVTRVVRVRDTVPPTIQLNGSSNIVMEVHALYIEQNATASDSVDGNLTDSIVINQNDLNTSKVGIYTVIYSVEDNSSNRAEANRTVQIVDTISPVITLNDANGTLGEKHQYMEVHSSYDEKQAVVTDNYDANKTIGGDTSELNISKIGDYNVIYDANDSSNNSAQEVNRTVTVQDTQAPTIVLNGNDTIRVEAGSSFSDEYNATVSDNYDANRSIEGNTSDVNTSKVGDYNVIYDTNDSSGNLAHEVNRTVVVRDTNSPTITLNGSSNITIEVHHDYTEQNATATDSIDGNLTDRIVIDQNDLNRSKVGIYTVIYSVEDNSSNRAEANRTVKVVDTTKPIIVLNDANATAGEKHQYMEIYTNYIEMNATLTDNYDSNETIGGDSTELNTSKFGDYNISYDANDSNHNSADRVNRIVTVRDTTPPEILLNGNNTITVEAGGNFVDEYNATVTDNYDANRTLEGNATDVNMSKEGTYSLSYDTNDSSGNLAIEVNRTVKVDDTIPPTLKLNENNGSVNYNLEANASDKDLDTYFEYNATADDRADGNLTGSIVIDTSELNLSKKGDYNITYTITDAAGNTAEQNRTITVVDTTAPIISITGDNPQSIKVGQDYTELNATAEDNLDGDISARIDINSSEVNTSKIGDYNVTYNVADSTGLKAIEVNRTVRVVDGTKPVITLIGDKVQDVKKGDTYKEYNATANDNVDGNITDKIDIDSTEVDTSKEGDYNVTYNVEDNDGNKADEVIRVVHVRDFKIKKTGQMASYDADGNEVHNIKDDGNYTAGVDTNYTRDDSNDTVTDNITGLMWADNNETNGTTYQWLDGVVGNNGDADHCSDGGTKCFNYINGSTKVDGDIAGKYCDTLVLGGYSDWRVPTDHELQYIVDWGMHDPAIDGSAFLYVASANYWTSITKSENNASAMVVDMSNGDLSSTGKDAKKYVRCVRDTK